MKHKAIVLCLFAMAVLSLTATLGAQARSSGASLFGEDAVASVAYRPATPADGCRPDRERVAEQVIEDCHVSLPPGGDSAPADTFSATDGAILKDAVKALEDRFGKWYRRVMSEQQMTGVINRLDDLQRLKFFLPDYFTANTEQSSGRDVAAGVDEAASEATTAPSSGAGGGASAYQKINVPEAMTWTGHRTVFVGRHEVCATTQPAPAVGPVAGETVLVEATPGTAPPRR